MIPKLIHYCWFGKTEKPDTINLYINSWREMNPDYTIMEWNEDNFDLTSACSYVKEAYEAKKWAFVSDYVRLYALYNYGGIYLDTDVEAIKSYDELLDNKVFLCAESRYSLCTATIGAEKGSIFIEQLMKLYEEKHFINPDGSYNTTPNSQLIYELLHVDKGYVFNKDNIVQYDNLTIYPSEYFSPINCYTLKKDITDNTFSIHWYVGTWKSPAEKRKEKIKSIITRIIGEDNRNKIKRLLK